MAKSFDHLARRTTSRRTRERAARRTKELLGELVLCEIRQLAGKSQRQLAATLGIRNPVCRTSRIRTTCTSRR
jgi:hypothetical protein